MAKKSAVEKNERRKRAVAKHAAKRAELKAKIMDRNASDDERWEAAMKLSTMPRDGIAHRVRNRCEVSGRPRGFYRKFKMSRIALRELGSQGKIPGVVKSSW